MRPAHALRSLTAFLSTRLPVSSPGALSSFIGTPTAHLPSTVPLPQSCLRAHSASNQSEALIGRTFASMAHGDYETIKVSTENAIGTIILSRPKALNALNDKVNAEHRPAKVQQMLSRLFAHCCSTCKGKTFNTQHWLCCQGHEIPAAHMLWLCRS